MLALILLAVLLLSACGAGEPAQSSSADNTQRTAEIARTFAGDSDLAKASAALGELQVANERQWLVLVTEQAIGGAQDTETTTALAKLAVALNLESTLIHTYAEQNGLLPQAAVVAAPEATATNVPPTAEATAETAPAATAEATPTNTSEPLLALALPTPTAATAAGATGPTARANDAINVRSGPGLDYPIIDLLDPASSSAIVGKNAGGDWLEVDLNGATGWVYASLVTTAGDLAAVTVAVDIPAPPTPEPTAVAAAPSAAPTAAEAAPAATEAPAEVATTDPNAQPYFRVIEHRMWSKAENGACAGQHLLRINVIDANGVRINGVRLQGIYTGEILVTGSQGKGDGVIEYDLYGTGEGFRVIQNDDGRPVTSDNAEGFTTKSLDIPVPTLIQGGYCTDDADCQIFYNSYGCTGHHSWEATFQRNY